MPARAEDYEVLHTIGAGSYGRCQKIRRKSDGKEGGNLDKKTQEEQHMKMEQRLERCSSQPRSTKD